MFLAKGGIKTHTSEIKEMECKIYGKKPIQVNILNPGIRKYKVIVAIATTNQLLYTQLLQY